MKDCTECSAPADAPKEQQSESYPICAKCLSQGWTSDPKEIRDALLKDTELRSLVNIKSPIQPETL